MSRNRCRKLSGVVTQCHMVPDGVDLGHPNMGISSVPLFTRSTCKNGLIALHPQCAHTQRSAARAPQSGSTRFKWIDCTAPPMRAHTRVGRSRFYGPVDYFIDRHTGDSVMPSNDYPTVSHRNREVASLKSEPIPWIWDGVIADGAVTLLSAPEKVGKSTLMSLLLDRRRDGGQLLGRTVRPGRTVVCSEENDRVWALREPPLDFGGRVEFCRPLDGPPSRGRWRRFMDYVFELHCEENPCDLAVIDTALRFLPPTRRNSDALRKALEDLHDIAEMLGGVLLLHQTPTARRALAAFADILIDIECPSGDRFTRRRDFTGVGRYPGTLQHVAAELSAEGTDYIVLPDAAPAPALGRALETLRQFLSEFPEPLT